MLKKYNIFPRVPILLASTVRLIGRLVLADSIENRDLISRGAGAKEGYTCTKPCSINMLR